MAALAAHEELPGYLFHGDKDLFVVYLTGKVTEKRALVSFDAHFRRLCPIYFHYTTAAGGEQLHWCHKRLRRMQADRGSRIVLVIGGRATKPCLLTPKGPYVNLRIAFEGTRTSVVLIRTLPEFPW